MPLFCIVVSQHGFAENLVSRPVGFIRLTIPSNARVIPFVFGFVRIVVNMLE